MKRHSFLLLALLAFLNAGVGVLQAANHPYVQQQKTLQMAPFCYVGQLLFNSGRDQYVGSATVIGASAVLTAGHNVFDPDAGMSTNVTFRRARYGAASTALSTVSPTHLYVLSGYQQNSTRYGMDALQSFAYDCAGMTFAAPVVTGGKHATPWGAPQLITNSCQRAAIGYGAEGAHTGDYPLVVLPYTSFTRIYGYFAESQSVYFEGGMSGGPLFSNYGGGTYVAGIVVSGSTAPEAGGIRQMDPVAVSFINTYLK